MLCALFYCLPYPVGAFSSIFRNPNSEIRTKEMISSPRQLEIHFEAAIEASEINYLPVFQFE